MDGGSEGVKTIRRMRSITIGHLEPRRRRLTQYECEKLLLYGFRSEIATKKSASEIVNSSIAR